MTIYSRVYLDRLSLFSVYVVLRVQLGFFLVIIVFALS